jgi:hypothetical protein
MKIANYTFIVKLKKKNDVDPYIFLSETLKAAK